MRGLVLTSTFLAAGMIAAASAPALAAPIIVYNTGQNGAGVVNPGSTGLVEGVTQFSDAHWTFTETSPDAGGGSPQAVTMVPATGWLANDAPGSTGSAWISQDYLDNLNPSQGAGAPGFHVWLDGFFQTTFFVTGIPGMLTNISLDVSLFVDNNLVSANLNGHDLGVASIGGPLTPPPFSFSVTNASWFNTGAVQNVLTFVIHNNNNDGQGHPAGGADIGGGVFPGPAGFRANVSGTANPEPATWALFGMGVLGLAGLARARRRQAVPASR